MGKKTKVILKCQFGDSKPDSSIELDEETAKKLLDRGDAILDAGEDTGKNEVTELNTKLAEKENEVTELNTKLAEFEGLEVGTLKKEITALKAKVTKLETALKK